MNNIIVSLVTSNQLLIKKIQKVTVINLQIMSEI